MKPTDFPSNGRDWEARRHTDFAISPNQRGRDTDYPVNDDNSIMKVANFNGVGGGTVIYTAHWPRLHPSDFKVKSLDGVADDWPIDYWALERFYEENDRMMGSSGLPGDPGVPPRHPPMPPIPLGKTGARYAKAMNKLGWHWWPVRHQHRHHRATRAGRAASTSVTARRAARRAPRPAPTSPTGRSRSAPASSCARAAGCARSPPTNTAWRPVRSTTTPTGASSSSRPKS